MLGFIRPYHLPLKTKPLKIELSFRMFYMRINVAEHLCTLLRRIAVVGGVKEVNGQ